MDNLVKCIVCGDLDDWEEVQKVWTLDQSGAVTKGWACSDCQADCFHCAICGKLWDGLYLDCDEDCRLICPECM